MDVSVIIPVYNVAPYVKECLESVMRQTFSGMMECIIVDDCGTDNSVDIIEEMITTYTGIIKFLIIHHEHNRGVSAARNTGLDNATGEYVFFLDCDDVISDDCIELLYNKATDDSECIMVQAGIDTIPPDAPNPFKKTYKQNCAVTNNDVRKCYYELRNMLESVWNNLIKRRFLIDNSIYFKEGRLAEDMLWMFSLLKHVHNVRFINDITYHYRKRENSISNNLDYMSRTRFMESIGDNYYDILLSMTPNKEKQELNYLISSFSYYYVRFVKEITVYEKDYHLFYMNAKKYRCHIVKMKLVVSRFLGKFKKGWWLLMILKLIRHPLTISKKVLKILSPKNKLSKKTWISSTPKTNTTDL